MSEEKVLTLQGKKAVWAPGGPIDPKRLPEGYPYKEQSWTVLAENVSVTTNDSGDYALGSLDEAFGSYLFNAGYDDFEYWPGLVCKVIFDGAEYVREIKKHIGAMNPTCLGNAGLHAEYGFEDTGEPFCFWVDSGATAFGTKTAGTHTFSVYLQSETIQPMAEEFMPLLTSPNGTKYKMTVSEDGTLSAVKV